MLVEESVELEKAGGSICDDFFGIIGEINSCGRKWLSMLADQLRSGGDFTTLAPL